MIYTYIVYSEHFIHILSTVIKNLLKNPLTAARSSLYQIKRLKK